MKIIEQIVRVTTDGNETKAEVVGELTRCKNCKLFGKMCETDPEAYCSMAQRKDGNYYRCHYSGYYVSGDFYCAYGERKETENGNQV